MNKFGNKKYKLIIEDKEDDNNFYYNLKLYSDANLEIPLKLNKKYAWQIIEFKSCPLELPFNQENIKIAGIDNFVKMNSAYENIYNYIKYLRNI